MEYLTLNSFSTKRSVTIDSLKTHFLPIQEGEGDPSPENVRPITGWNSIKIRKTGKNLAKIVGYSAQNVVSSSSSRSLTNNYGTTISSTDNVDELIITQTNYPNSDIKYSYNNGYFAVVLDGLPFEKRYNVFFRISNIVSNPFNISLDTNIMVICPYGDMVRGSVSEDGLCVFRNLYFRRRTLTPDRCSVEIRNCGMSFTLSEFMITAVEDEDFTYEPYSEEEVEVELPETMYGGYVDISKGEIVQEYYKYIITGNENFSAAGSWVTIYLPRPFDISTIALYPGVGICTHYPYAPYKRGKIGVMYNERNLTFDGNILDADGWKAFCKDQYDNGTPVEVCYKLKEPKSYPLPPETLKTLRGFNTVFSTTNDTIEVGYSEMSPTSLLKRRRDIIASEPHLVTVETGNTEDSDIIASFKTNAVLPIKSMVTNFEPKQEGEGDPSPENIRPITGLSELEIHNFPHLVQWNQWLQPLTEEHWRAYDTSNNTVTFSEDGVATNEWLNTNIGYLSSIRNKVGTLQSEGQVWYVSYMVRHHGQDTKRFGVECCGGRQLRSIVEAEPENWYQVSVVTTYNRGTRNYVYIANMSDTASAEVGLMADVKAPIHINLTQMFGAGNEPTKDEFEAQCALNGIDLTTYNPYDEGTVMPWRTSENEDQVYNIPLTLPNLITPEPKSITSYNVDFTVNEDGTVDYEGTPTSYAVGVVGYYYVKGGETITVTLCGDIANLCFNAQSLYDSSYNRISFLGNVNNYEGKITYTIDLSEYPDAYILKILLKRYSNNVYMKGKCWVRVVEGTVDTGDEVFGGYIDLENNELVKTWECVGLDSLSWSIWCANTETYPDAVPVFINNERNSDISAYAKRDGNGIQWLASGLKNPSIPGANRTQMSGRLKENNTFSIAQSGGAGMFTIRADQFDNVADLKRFLQGKKVAYPKEVPVHFPLSSTVIRTLKGMNNIYTNANGKTIIKYWTH